MYVFVTRVIKGSDKNLKIRQIRLSHKKANLATAKPKKFSLFFTRYH